MPVAVQVTKEDIASPSAWDMCHLTSELLKRDNDLTPDWLKIKLQHHHPLFVYGTLRPGGVRHSMIKEYPTFGEGYTVTNNFVMRDVQGQFPAVHDAMQGQEHTSARVYGDVYIVPPDCLLDMDVIEQNGRMYQRREVWIYLVDQTLRARKGSMTPSIKCWMYVARTQWIGQTQSTICIRKTSSADDRLHKYWEWENKKPETQLTAMQQIWKMNEGYMRGMMGPLARAGIATE